MRKTHHSEYGIEDVYKYYLTQPSSIKDKKLFKEVWKFYANFLIEDVILKGKRAYIPYNGAIEVRSKKATIKKDKDGNIDKAHLKVDYKKTRELYESNPEAKEKGIKIYHLNLHTDRKYFHIKWLYKLDSVKFKGMTSYALRIMRGQKRKLPKKINEGGVFI